jgi:TonB family protein
VPPTRPAPRPAPSPPQARPATPNLPPGTLYLPQGLQLGRPQTPSPPAGRPQARGIDLTVDPRIIAGESSSDPNLNVTGARVGADWRGAFRRWLDENMRYPTRAIELGESGQVRVRVVAEPDGRVRSVRLVLPSGSPSLNLGTTMPFDGARLPAFPPPADPNGVTIDLTVTYRLIRRGG